MNDNDDIKCEICFTNKPVYIPVITCAHWHDFCEKCIKSWLAERRFTCPKCRATLPINYYVSKKKSFIKLSFIQIYIYIQLENTNQENENLTNVSLIQPLRQSFPTASNCFIKNILSCCSIGLLLAFIIYPTVKRI